MRKRLGAGRVAGRGVLLLLAAVVGGLVLARPADSATLHVSPGGLDSPMCGPQSAPCRHLDYAVNKALDGDTIRVAGGTYMFTSVAVPCTGVPTRSVLCVIDKSITIQGGYSPSTWALDPVANPTVIDGQNTYRGVLVYSSSSPSVRLTMANLIIQNGRVNATDLAAFGGGMDVADAAVTLDSVTFQSNQAIGMDTGSGAGGAAAGSALSIRTSRNVGASFLSDVQFQSNTSIGGHGPEMGGVAFGALFVFGTNTIVNVEDSSFTSNSALANSSTGSGQISNGQRADALGGAVGIEGGATVSLVRVTAIGNQAVGGTGTTYGGGAFGGAVFAEDSTVAIADSLFQSNVARGAASANGGFAAGGGVLLYNSNGTIDRTRIIANRATGGNGQVAPGPAGGGGLYLWRADPAVTLQTLEVANTVIADNTVELGQGSSNPGGGGGGLQVQALVAHLTHVTFARNQLGPGLVAGQAIVVVPSAAGMGTLNLEYSVIADHVASTGGATAVVVTQGNSLNLNRGAFTGNTHNINDSGPPMLPGTITGLASMITVGSPGFRAAGPPSYDYHITSGSPLRGVATGSAMAVDMDNQPRTGGTPDIGADEYVPTNPEDFNGDGKADILWRHTSGALAVWLMNGITFASGGSPGSVPVDWTIAGVGDFNGDGKADILLRHTSGALAVWLMNGTAYAGGGSPGVVPVDWTIAGVGDFNGDGKADILWRHTSGALAVWLMNGTALLSGGSPGSLPGDWAIVGVGDFNGDGKADILLRHTSGSLAVWLMDGTALVSGGSPGSLPGDWTIVGVGDFNGDGKVDILLRHTSGVLAVWLMNGTALASGGTPGSTSPDWTIVGVRDFNGDGKADILWRHTSGVVAMWLMNGTALTSAASLGSVTTDWAIQ